MAGPARLTTVADTGAVFALLDRRDVWHERVRAWWEAEAGDIVLPVTILPEIAHLVQHRRGAREELRFIRSLADGEFDVEPLESEDLPRISQVMEDYTDLALGFVDASVIVVAERLGTPRVLTTDRRHFGVVRPRHVERLRLEP